MNSILIGIAGGLTSAVLFSAPLGGGLLALPLSFLAVLPIAIAGLGWGTMSALVAAVTAIVVETFVYGPMPAAAFAVSNALPMALYAHLLGLARPVDDGAAMPAGAPVLECYPIGRILVMIAAISAGSIIALGFIGDYSVENFVAEARVAFAPLYADSPDVNRPDAETLDSMLALYGNLVPLISGFGFMALMTINLWLGAVVVRISGRLRRPKEPVAVTIHLPTLVVGIFGAAVIASMASGGLGLAARVVAGSFGMLLAIAGFAVVHVISRNNKARGVILAMLYGLTILFTLPILLMTALGAVDTLAGIRRRVLGQGNGFR
ncbi:hypothetical protein [Methylobrevis pamukkalensis]|uniref:DUF2232 domain-containing protein n=1 Tax=Methylobrevis pamukkalensis TaxID=1439726 RepID=A0A1E3H1Y0_9HYPH|nr:hypothetical protein [Methylobrevis pamukkalensis]ODN70312.1 hypothetical protein A6302_02346 [Methylobrevis pamukkalensis]